MIATIFKNVLKPLMQPLTLADYERAADAIATAYDVANVGSSMTLFGSILLKGDKETLKNFLLQGLTMNAGLVKYLPVVEPGWTMMANGFCMYWATATFTPIPPMPPIVSPLQGTQVIFPGSPSGLDIGLKVALTQGDLDNALNILSLVLIAHQLTIAGTYNGLVPTVPTPIPMIMPWVVILSIPDLDLGKKDDTVDQPQDEDVVEEGDQIGDEEVGDDGDEIVVDPLTEQLTELAKKLAELNTLSLNDLKERQDEVTSALGELNKLAYDEKIIESPKYSQVVGLMVSFNILLNKINSNQEVPPQRFPLDGDCIDCP
jgi:hypothetical protein